MVAINKFQHKALVALILFALSFSFVPLIVQASEGEETDDFYHGTPFSKEEITEQIKNGGLVRILDRSDEKYNIQETSNTAELLTSLPSKVDLRENGTVSSVKNQGETGTCWVFGTLATAEVSLSNATGAAPLDLSAYQTAFFGYEPISSDTSQLIGTEISQAGEGYHTKEGLENNRLIYGALEITAASMLMQGCGIALNSSIPFPEQARVTGVITDGDYLTTTQRRETIARVKNFSYLGCGATTKKEEDGTKTYVSTNETVLARVKKQLSSGNATTISYYGDDPYGGQDHYIAPGTYAQYTYTCEPANHVVCVVGYDDNYSKENFVAGHEPPKDGAYIVKNSWGTDWGVDGGYFYLSYYDQSIAEIYAFDFDVSTYDVNKIDANAEIVDQYDYLQANFVWAYYKDDPKWYSNIYTSSKKQQLHNIATYICDESVNQMYYKVYKLKSDAKTPLDVQGSVDSPDAQGVYVSDYEGYVSIELDEPINLAEGEKYAIVFSQETTEGEALAPVPSQFDDSYTINKVAGANTVVNEGESFYTSELGSAWKSWTETHHNTDATDNFCAKGYATSMEGTPFVMFNSNGGTTVATQAVKVGSLATEPATPTREGYTFKGWFTDELCTQSFDFSSKISEDVTLWAKWETVSSEEVVVKPDSTQSVDYSSNLTDSDSALTPATPIAKTGDSSLMMILFAITSMVAIVVIVAFIAKYRRSI